MLRYPKLHEIVITKSETQVLDIGFVDEVAPLRIQARHHTYQSDNPPYYGGAEYTNWQHTGVYTTEEQWKKLTKNTPTDKVCEIFHIPYRFEKKTSDNPERPSLDRKLVTMLFCQYFEVSCLMDEPMEKMETDALLDFISEKFREEYSIEEFLQFNEDHSTCELGCLNDEEKAAVIAALFQIDYDDAKEQLEAFQDEKEPDFEEWWENLDDIEREEYNRLYDESELE